MTGIENQTLRGITIKNMIVTVVCTASIVASVMGTYYSLRDDIKSGSNRSEEYQRMNNLRLNSLENRQNIIDQQIRELQGHHQ